MAESKEGQSFFRKVVKFVANPATEWSEVGSRQDEPRDSELEKSELKAMIERKRRNDFVRKREFDTLRRLRREGLSPEQLAALGGSSRIDDPDARISESGLRQDTRVKAKIDEIEKQMVGEGARMAAARRTTGFGHVATEPLAYPPSAAGRRATGLDAQQSSGDDGEDEAPLPALPPLPDFDRPSAPPSAATMGSGLPALHRSAGATAPDPPRRLSPLPPFVQTGSDAVEVSEVVHDPELDEAVISFANADFGHCEHSLTQLLAPGGGRTHHPETWLVLFDLYRAIGQQAKFESLAIDYANLFGSSSPQWFSMPRLVAEAVVAEEKRSSVTPRPATEVGWIAPEHLDVDAVAKLRSVTLQLPLPWVMDWAAVRHVDAEAASQLTALMQQWAGQKVEMRWLGGDQLLGALNEEAPTGARGADPAFWMARLEALRLANRPDQFDEAAIDYCITYEVSPPSWERAECTARIVDGSSSANSQHPAVSEVTTSFFESSLQDDSQHGLQIANVELSGQLIGDIGETLARLDRQVHAANLVTVSCARLIRVDFVAAGDLLNWVLAKRNQERSVTFSDAHRLVALFFGAMGINEHARVQVRRN